MDVVQVKADRRVRLRVYLNDHLAAATGGIALARRCRSNNAGTALADYLDGFLSEIGEDRSTVRGLLDDLDMAPAKPKQALVMAAERVGRLKLNGQLIGYSALGRLVELEALCSGVEAKRNLWVSLQEIAAVEEPVARLDLQGLVERAERQRTDLEEHRRAAAAEALGDRLAESS